MLPRIIVVKEVGSSFLQMMATSKLETTCIAIVIEKVLKAKQFEVKTTFEFKRFSEDFSAKQFTLFKFFHLTK